MTKPIFAIPVKPFDVAKRRLATAIPEAARAHLSRSLAQHTADVVAATAAVPLILSADDTVTRWADERGLDVLLDEGSSLDQAARSAVRFAEDRDAPWAVLHADLPLLAARHLERAIQLLLDGRTVLAPSADGGTSFLGGSQPIEFAYGPGSFHRHLARIRRRDPIIVWNQGLVLDLDEPVDLEAAVRHPDGTWLADFVHADTVA